MWLAFVCVYVCVCVCTHTFHSLSLYILECARMKRPELKPSLKTSIGGLSNLAHLHESHSYRPVRRASSMYACYCRELHVINLYACMCGYTSMRIPICTGIRCTCWSLLRAYALKTCKVGFRELRHSEDETFGISRMGIVVHYSAVTFLLAEHDRAVGIALRIHHHPHVHVQKESEIIRFE